jgi:hypothetical protein
VGAGGHTTGVQESRLPFRAAGHRLNLSTTAPLLC